MRGQLVTFIVPEKPSYNMICVISIHRRSCNTFGFVISGALLQEGSSVSDRDGSTAGDDAHEFTPYGTAALLGIYFTILVFMWIFMYFIEFLGNGPTIVG